MRAATPSASDMVVLHQVVTRWPRAPAGRSTDLVEVQAHLAGGPEVVPDLGCQAWRGQLRAVTAGIDRGVETRDVLVAIAAEQRGDLLGDIFRLVEADPL